MLNIDMEFRKGILFVRLNGILNGDTAQKLDEELTSTINNNGIKYLLLNLKELISIDKYGMNIIIKNYINITNNQGKFIICGINKLFEYNGTVLKNLYQVNNEMKAFEVINI